MPPFQRKKYGFKGIDLQQLAEDLVTLKIYPSFKMSFSLCCKASYCCETLCSRLSKTTYEVHSQNNIYSDVPSNCIVNGVPGRPQLCSCHRGNKVGELCYHKLATYLKSGTSLRKFYDVANSSSKSNLENNSYRGKRYEKQILPNKPNTYQKNEKSTRTSQYRNRNLKKENHSNQRVNKNIRTRNPNQNRHAIPKSHDDVNNKFPLNSAKPERTRRRNNRGKRNNQRNLKRNEEMKDANCVKPNFAISTNLKTNGHFQKRKPIRTKNFEDFLKRNNGVSGIIKRNNNDDSNKIINKNISQERKNTKERREKVKTETDTEYLWQKLKNLKIEDNPKSKDTRSDDNPKEKEKIKRNLKNNKKNEFFDESIVEAFSENKNELISRKELE